MRSYPYILAEICIICLFALSRSSSGQAEPIIQLQKCEQNLTLEELRAYALSNSPLVAEIDQVYASQLAAAFEVETLQNPELQLERTYTRMKIGGTNDPQAQVSLAQPLRISNFGSRGSVADLLKKAGDLQKRAALMELIQKLTLQYETLAAYQQMELILINAEKRVAKNASTVREGVKKGLLSSGDEHLFEGEQFRLQAQAKSIAASIAIQRSELSKSVGIPCKINAEPPKAISLLPAELVLLQQAKENQIGEAARIDLLLALSKEQVRLAELDAYPQITPRLVYQHTNDGGDFLGAGISVPLPFWNRNQGGRSKADAEYKVAEVRSNFVKNGGLENQIVMLRSAVVNAEEQAQLFTNKVVPSFHKALNAQEKRYVEGNGNVLQVWQTARALNEVQTQGIQLLLDAKSLRIQLSVLVGAEI